MTYRSRIVAAFACVGVSVVSGAQQNSSAIALRGHSLGIAGMSVSSSPALIATASLDGTLRLWTPTSQNGTLLMKGLNQAYAVSLSPDATRVAVVAWQQPLHVMDTRGGTNRRSFSVGNTYCGAVAWSPDGMRIAAGCADSRLRIWNAATGQIDKEIPGAGGLNAIAWLPDGSGVVTSSGIWSVSSGQRVHAMTGHRASVRSIAVSRDGKRIITASMDKTIRIWNAATGETQLTLAPAGFAIHTDTGWIKSDMTLPQTAAAFSADGKYLASGGADRIVRVWDAASGKELGDLFGHTMTVMAVAFLDDHHVVSASLDGTVRIWDFERDMRRLK
jgi:WD40 repeat protein